VLVWVVLCGGCGCAGCFLLLECYFLRLVVAAFLALVVAAVMLSERTSIRRQTCLFFFFSGSCLCLFVVVGANAARTVLLFVV
jgi:hypothetical protein